MTGTMRVGRGPQPPGSDAADRRHSARAGDRSRITMFHFERALVCLLLWLPTVSLSQARVQSAAVHKPVESMRIHNQHPIRRRSPPPPLLLKNQTSAADHSHAAHLAILSQSTEAVARLDDANSSLKFAANDSLASNRSAGLAELNPDASDTVPVYMQHMTVVLVALHLSVFITGLVGNSLVCLSVWRSKSLQTVTNYYIVNLAVADFLVILICLPPTVYWDLNLTWNFGLVPCKLVLYLQSISVSVSVLTLTCISFDRWYAICKPLEFCSTKSRAKKAIGLIWLVSMVIASPDVIFLTTRPLYEEEGYVYMDCTYSWPEESTKIYQLCIVTLLFVFPFVLMIISYSHIVNVLWRNETMAETMRRPIGPERVQRRRFRLGQLLSTSVRSTTANTTTTNCPARSNQHLARKSGANKSINSLGYSQYASDSMQDEADRRSGPGRAAAASIRSLEQLQENSSCRSEDSSMDRQSSWRDVRKLHRDLRLANPFARDDKTVLNNINNFGGGGTNNASSFGAQFDSTIITRPKLNCYDHDCRLVGQNISGAGAKQAPGGSGAVESQDDDIVAVAVGGGEDAECEKKRRRVASRPDTFQVGGGNRRRNTATGATGTAIRHLVGNSRGCGAGRANCSSGDVWHRCFNPTTAAEAERPNQHRAPRSPLAPLKHVPKGERELADRDTDGNAPSKQIMSSPVHCSQLAPSSSSPSRVSDCFGQENSGRAIKSEPITGEIDDWRAAGAEPARRSAAVVVSHRLSDKHVSHPSAEGTTPSSRSTAPGDCLEIISEELLASGQPWPEEAEQTMADKKLASTAEAEEYEKEEEEKKGVRRISEPEISRKMKTSKLESDKSGANLRRLCAGCRKRPMDKRASGIKKTLNESNGATFSSSSRLDDGGLVVLERIKSNNKSGPRKRRGWRRCRRRSGDCDVCHNNAQKLVERVYCRIATATARTADGLLTNGDDNRRQGRATVATSRRRTNISDSAGVGAFAANGGAKQQSDQSKPRAARDADRSRSMILIRAKTASLSERLDCLDCCQSCFLITPTNEPADAQRDQHHHHHHYKLFVGGDDNSFGPSSDGSSKVMETSKRAADQTDENEDDAGQFKKRLSDTQIQSRIESRRRLVCLIRDGHRGGYFGARKLDSEVLMHARASTTTTATSNGSNLTDLAAQLTDPSGSPTNQNGRQLTEPKEDDDETIACQTDTRYASSYAPSSSDARFCKLIESRKKAAKMLIVIVIMFGLCYLPIHFLNTLRYTTGLPQNDLTTIASLVSHWLCYFNSAVNPLIYNLMSGKFRHEFANLFFCRCFRRTATN